MVTRLFSSSLGEYLVEPVVCINASVNFRYDKPLPGANSIPTTVHATDSGIWKSCQFGALRVPISYYLTLTAKNANCEKATFSDYVFTGFFNCSTLLGLPANVKNLTVPLSDSDTTRYLNEAQPFLAPIVIPISVTVPYLTTIQIPVDFTVPGFGSLYAVNFTFIFPEENHRRGSCGPVASERVAIIPQLYLINLSNSDDTSIVSSTVAECK